MQKRAKQFANAAKQNKKEKEDAENEKLMKDLEAVAEDEDLLAGLDQLAKKEEEELQQVRRPSGAIGVEQGQGKESTVHVDSSSKDIEQKKEKEPADDGYWKTIVIVCALALAGGAVVYKYMHKK